MPEDLQFDGIVWELDETQNPDRYPNGIFKLTYKPQPETPDDTAKNYMSVTGKINMRAKSFGSAADPTRKNADVTNQLRSKYLEDLRDLARKLCDGKIDDRKALEEYGLLSGMYAAQSNEIAQREAATVGMEDFSDDSDSGTWSLKLNQLQPGATPEQTALFIEIQRAYDVVDIVMDRRQTFHNKVTGIRSGGLEAATIRKSQIVRKNYVHQLKEIAEEGLLSRELTGYAVRKLDLFKEAFVQREADRVKNQHVKALGAWVLVFAATLLVLVALLEVLVLNWDSIEVTTTRDGIPTKLAAQVWNIREFLFLAIGASVGAWMSFTLRKVELGFDELILLEPDRLNPSARIIFVIILTLVVGGVLQLGWVSVSFAEGKQLKPSEGPGQAMLLGILCGIAERSLSGAVVGRAQSVSRVIQPKTAMKGSHG